MDPLPDSTFCIRGSLNTEKCYCHRSINTILSNNGVLQKMDPNVARSVERGQPEQNERADPGHFFSQMHKFVQDARADVSRFFSQMHKFVQDARADVSRFFSQMHKA